jgi:hypothetical protein
MNVFSVSDIDAHGLPGVRERHGLCLRFAEKSHLVPVELLAASCTIEGEVA